MMKVWLSRTNQKRQALSSLPFSIRHSDASQNLLMPTFVGMTYGY